MKFYQEVTLVANDDLKQFAIWSRLYSQLHIALADVANQHGIRTIGVSFPNYRRIHKNGKDVVSLGNRLRIFAPHREDLEVLNLSKWLERLTDYVHIKRIAEVGNKPTGYVVVERYRKPDVKKQAMSFAKFKNIPFEESIEHCTSYKQSAKSYPFIELRSETNRHSYRLYICQTFAYTPVSGEFNPYGFSSRLENKKVTVPHW